jgi:hypothetical protein
MSIFFTSHGDTATITYSDGFADFHFEAWVEGRRAFVEYQETQIGRGRVIAKDPSEEVYRSIIQSDSLTSFMDRNGALTTVKLRPKG